MEFISSLRRPPRPAGSTDRLLLVFQGGTLSLLDHTAAPGWSLMATACSWREEPRLAAHQVSGPFSITLQCAPCPALLAAGTTHSSCEQTGRLLFRLKKSHGQNLHFTVGDTEAGRRAGVTDRWDVLVSVPPSIQALAQAHSLLSHIRVWPAA